MFQHAHVVKPANKRLGEGFSMRRVMRYVSIAAAVTCSLTLVSVVHAVPTYYTSRPAFSADARVTTTTTIDFDGLAPGTDLTGGTLSGVTFTAPGASPLSVILGATGVRFPMSPSSGANVLSPGGSSTSLENDDLQMVFGTAAKAVGMDVVFDAPDGLSYVSVTFFDASDVAICSHGFIPAPVGPPGYQFVGCVSDSANIKRVLFDEFDGSESDDHVAYDTLTFSPAFLAPPPPPTEVPAPATLLLLGSGLVGLRIWIRRRR